MGNILEIYHFGQEKPVKIIDGNKDLSIYTWSEILLVSRLSIKNAAERLGLLRQGKAPHPNCHPPNIFAVSQLPAVIELLATEKRKTPPYTIYYPHLASHEHKIDDDVDGNKHESMLISMPQKDKRGVDNDIRQLVVKWKT